MGEKVRKFRVVVWGEAPDTPEERKLLRKIDFFILTYCCIAFFFNYLDRAVLANAYVSGMKEDISLTGNQYNLLVTCLSVGCLRDGWDHVFWCPNDGNLEHYGWKVRFAWLEMAIFGFVFFPDLPESTKAFYLNARIVLTLFTSVTIDATGVHAPYGFFACGVQMITCIILLCWDSVGVGAKLGAFYLAGTAYMIQPIVFVWANKILSYDGDDAARAIILYSMNGASSVLFAFWGIVLYPTTDAATGFRKGTIAMVVVTICLAMWICIVWWQDKRAHSIQLTQGISGTKSIEEIEINTKRKADEEM
ncbi:hypothetical protein TCE0_042f15475 [Talaromyces pinophilus]|uniref:Uncharacterized protein n=1 Tax=Talaromyces pinophilus TaxID=128442 RepID=A0A6V8HKG4_TALPI|nr:hypothetical protein TCE0_042f15475 [Talaromyces pinophilus]